MRTSTEKSLGKVTFNHFFENVRDALLRGGRMTKYKGIVASYAPSLGKILDLPSLAGFGALSRGGTAALLLAAAPVTLTGTTALAGVCGPVFPGLYTCAFGENDGVDVTQSLLSAGGGLTVTTTLGFGIDTTTNGGTAIELATVAPHVGLVFNDTYASNITGAVSGIVAYNISGGGDTYVYTRGVTRGLNGNGIVAADSVAGGDVTVVGGQVYGYGIGDAAVYGINNGAGNLSITVDNVVALSGDGIEAQNYGEGNLTITVENGAGAASSVVSTGSDGIDAYNLGGDLTATVIGNVYGYARGIDANNQGDGDLYIHAYDDVTGQNNDGIRAVNGATAGNLTILADGAVSGGDEGIQATNDGSGLLSITATDVEGLGGDGIRATGGANGTGVSVTANNVSGADDGIQAENNGTGDVVIHTYGDVTGAFGDGIQAENNNVLGRSITIVAGAGTTILGDADGIDARNSGFGSVFIDVDTVTGSTDDGIYALNSANSTAGVTVIAGDVTGDSRGIAVKNYGEAGVLVTMNGDVTSANADGVYVYNSANDVTNSTVITQVAGAVLNGGTDGIHVLNLGGSVSVNTQGEVHGLSGDGMDIQQDANYDVDVVANIVSGTANGIYIANNGTGDVSVTTNGVISGGAGSSGIRIEDQGGDVTVTANDLVTGGDFGIYVNNFGDGDLSITTGSGAILATNQDAIYAFSGSAAGDLTIETGTGAVHGGDSGIQARNTSTTGSTSVTANSDTRGYNSDGINAYNYGVNLSVETNAYVQGYDDGIAAENRGSGTLSITTNNAAVVGDNGDGINARNEGTSLTIDANDTVTGGTGYGIYAYNTSSGTTTSLTIDTMAVNGGVDGIRARNEGSAALTINTAGAVVGGNGLATGSGIHAINEGTDLTVNAGDTVSGLDDGIFADNNGSGGLTITTAAAVNGTNFDGIYARNSGTVLSIDANADVTGGDDGIDAVNEAGSTSMLINTMAVTGNDDGIYASNLGSGDMTITADGAVEGTTGDGIDAYNDGGNMFITVNDTVLGADYGIAATNDGSGLVRVTTSAGNLVEGTNEDGIHIENRPGATSVEVIANGAVLGGDQGIFVDNQGTAGVSVSIFDDVTGNGDQGVYIYNSTNDITTSTYFYQAAASTLIGATDGLYINNGGGSITVNALGEITGLGGDGVEAYQQANGDVSVTTNIVTGTQNGINVNNDGTGDVEVITNGATTGGAGFSGILIEDAGGDVDVTTNAAVTGGDYGIKVENDGTGDATITTNDTVNGDVEDGIYVWNNVGTGGITVTAGVDAGDTVTGGDDGIYVDNDGTGAVLIVANGAVTGTAGDGVYAANSGTSLTIDTNADVDGGDDGISATNEASATTTSVTITTEAVTGGADGIDADNNGSGALDIQTNGVITGTAGDGIQADNDGTDLTILTMAAVTGGTDGIDAINTAGTQALSITTNGTVDGTTGDGINADNWGTTLAIDAYDTVTGGDDGIYAINQASGTTTTLTINTVAVTGGDDGIYARNNGSDALSITTDGAILGTGGRGIVARNQGTSLTIDANDSVTGGTYGILAANLATATTTDVTINTMAVTGGSADGINAYNGGSGVLDITTAGIVTGGDDGIDAQNEGTDLTIDAQMAVTGANDGINADNNGTGVVDITTVGVVTGTAGNGIAAYNDGTSIAIDAQAAVTGGGYGILASNNPSGTTTDITIDTVDVTGGISGVSSINFGSGATGITTAGNVTGTTISGISAIDFFGSGDITIDAQGDVTGGQYGIFVRNYGGAVDLTTAAGFVVDGQTEDGIHVYNGVDATPGNPTTSVTVTNNGVVHGGDQGIYIHNLGTAGVTVNVNANVTGDGDQGLYIYNSAYDVSASVVVTQLAGTTINGATDGSYVNNFGGSITMTMLGSVNGLAGDGIDARNNVGTTFMDITAYNVTGTQNGINALNLGTGFQTITTNAGGTVTGLAGAGINAINGPASTGNQTIAVNGDVNGGSVGVFALNYGAADQEITSAAGTTISSYGIGIAAVNSNYSVNQIVTTDGDVNGTYVGIGTFNAGTGYTDITTNGTVSSNYVAIAAINYGTTTQMDVTTNGAVTGGYAGVIAANAGGGDLTVTTNSTVAGGTYAGVVGIAYGPNAQNVIIETNDAVTAGFAGVLGIQAANGDLTITTNGTVDSTTGAGVTGVSYGPNAGAVTITTNEAVTGQYAGVAGVQAANGTLDITTNGTVDGGVGVGVGAAAYGANATDITVVTNETVDGDFAGVGVLNYGVGNTDVTTNMAVTSASGYGIGVINGPTSGDLTVLANAGSAVSGDLAGVAVNQYGSGVLSVTTNDTVTSANGDGIFASSTSTAGFDIIATAAVTGGDNGIYASVEYAETMNITVSSAITGGTGAGIETESYNAAAVDYLGNAVVTLNNGATVSAASGDAIINDGGDSDTYANAGALIVGNVYLGDGNDNLTFTSSSINSVGILDGGDDVSTADGMVDILSIDNVFGNLTGGDTINWEEIHIGAFSSVFMDDAAMTAGLVVVEGFGNLDFGNAFALTGDMQIDAGGDLFASGLGAGLYSVSGDLTNNGRIEMRDGQAGDRLAVGGDYTSTTGILNGDVDFSFGTDAVDGLDIAGDVNLGNTNVFLDDVMLGFASGNDILFAGVGGTSFGTFTLTNGPITTGIWDYDMEQIGQDWWLTGDINATGAVYEATPAHLLQFANLPTMQQRIGQRATGGTGAGMSTQNVDVSTQGYGGATGPQAWARVIGSKVETGPTVSTALITDQDHSQWGIEAGIDISTDTPGLSFGILAHAGGVSTMVTNPIGYGTMDSRGFGVGATATWVNADGFYVDAQARATWIKSDLWSTTHGQLMTDYESSTYALSVEAGKRIELGGGGTLIPQAQLTWGQSVGGAFIDNVANVVDLGTNTSLIGRVGLAYEFDNQNGHSFYAIGNILRDFSDPTVVDANSTILNNAGPTTWLEVGLGGTYSMSDTTSVYGEITYQTELGGGGSMGYGASAGISIQW